MNKRREAALQELISEFMTNPPQGMSEEQIKEIITLICAQYDQKRREPPAKTWLRNYIQ